MINVQTLKKQNQNQTLKIEISLYLDIQKLILEIRVIFYFFHQHRF